ncbi:double-strand break repair protein AddB [Aristophania vespae]|uniref:double-strand break repair protein AddB n=1 Tax=Aristophania vespae TaxID=2697033 RepID=UPI00211058F2|nr:double-strand break repair protein AddB [Aristophania vespae]
MTVATIPASCSFLDSVAQSWIEKIGLGGVQDGDDLGERGLILVPGRRAARALMEAFLRVLDGRAALLPDIVAIGDVGESDLFTLPLEAELAPPVDPMRRLSVLSQLILHAPLFRSAQGDEAVSLERVWPLARALAELMDEAERCNIDLKEALPKAVEEEFAHHWQQTLLFLQIVTEFWPKWLKEQGLTNPVAQHATLLKTHAELWRRHPPSTVVWAIGFSDGLSGVGDFLKVVASLPKGVVILQAVDMALEDSLWEALSESHPQFLFRDLLAELHVERSELEIWGKPVNPQREDLLREVLLPEEGLASWAHRKNFIDLSALSLLKAADIQEEAVTIALILRDVASHPGKSAALVTPDRDLAKRVRAALLRYGIHADDSAGESLSRTPVAVFLRQIAQAVSSQLAPVPLLSLLKHPFASLGMKPGECRSLARLLEKFVLRGPAPEAGFPGLYAALEERLSSGRGVYKAETQNIETSSLKQRLKAFLEKLEKAFAPLLNLTGFHPMPVWLEALVRCAESLAFVAENNEQPSLLQAPLSPLWRGDDGAMMSQHLIDLMTYTEDLPQEAISGVEGFLTVSMADMTLRGLRGHQDGIELAHPRISILGVLEARLLSFDTVILGGLVENSWPPSADPGPWLSRPMRQKIGLLSPERTIGQSAHDFTMAILSAQNVVFAYAGREGGKPTVPSRWLARFEAFLSGQEVLSASEQKLPSHPALDWQSYIDLPLGDAKPVSPPQPRPPLALRPRQLSITDIDTLIRDPYGLYAERVLQLRALRPLEEKAEPFVFGLVVHSAMEAMTRRYPRQWPAQALNELCHYFDEALKAISIRAALHAWWKPRLKRIAQWVYEQERVIRSAKVPFRSYTEIEASYKFEALPGGQSILRGEQIVLMFSIIMTKALILPRFLIIKLVLFQKLKMCARDGAHS